MVQRILVAVGIVAALGAAATVHPPRALPAFSQAQTVSQAQTLPQVQTVSQAQTAPQTRTAATCTRCHPERSERKRAKSREHRNLRRGHRSRAHGKGRTRHPSPVVDVNRADVGTLAAVPGIGEDLAQRIVTFRALVGRFDSLDDLSDLDGLSESRLISLGRYLVVR